MRTTFDRIRQAIAFEVIALIMVIPLGSWGFGHDLADMGVVAVVSASIAMGWNYVFNLLFDHGLQRMRGSVQKNWWLRLLHASLFEAGILILLLPFIAWYLAIPVLEAFWVDISFSAFYMTYAFVFTWAYDTVFPVPDQVPTGK